MADHPKVLTMKRGGKYRRCYMRQEILASGAWCAVYRVAFMEIL